MKKFLVSIIAVFVCVFAYTGVDAKQLKKCTWKKQVQTCKYGAPNSEWHTTVVKHFNKNWRKSKQSTAHFPYDTPQKEITYKYSKYNNLVKKQTKWYNYEDVAKGKKVARKIETRYYNKRVIVEKYVNKYRSDKTKSRSEYATYKKGKLDKKIISTYNKKGKKKSNKDGNAYKYIRTYKKTKKGYQIKKQIKYKYNENGKLVKVK